MRELNPVEQMSIFYPDPAEQHMRQQGMREHLGGYLEGLENGTIDPGMRTYQRLGFPRILKKAYKDLGQPVDVHAETSEALDQLTHPQIAEATMGYGKSFLLAHLAVATGIGQLPYEGATQPLKALYISYTKRGVSEIAKACRTFTPQLKVVRYAEQPKAKQRIEEIEEGDVIAISYAALSIAVKRRLDGLHTPLDGQQFDLIGSDENHHRWSRSFGAAVNAFARGKVEVGMTGTRRITEENKNVPVSFRFSARDMVDTGHAPSVQLLAFPTGKAIAVGIRTPRDPFKAMEKSYSWKQLQPLALDPERNYQIVELLKMLASRGHTILGGMIAGARCTHGKIIKALANEESIVDPVTGKRRKLNFETVDGYMKDRIIDKLIERARYPFAESGLDGLLSTSLLTESVDNPNFSAAVVGSPMPFIPLAQLMGRLSRGEPTDTTVIAQLIDRASHTCAPAFIGDVYEEGEFFNGMIIGQKDTGGAADLPPAIDRKPSGRKSLASGGMRSSIDLEEVVKTTFGSRMDALESYLAEWRNVPIYSELFEANSTLLSEPPEDSIKVTDLYRLDNIREAEISEASFYELLQENGFRYSRVETDEGITNYVHQAGEVTAFLENYQFPPKDAPKRYTLLDLARSFSVSTNVITDEIATLTAAGEHMMPEVGKKGRLAYSDRQKELLGEALERRRGEMVPETDGHPYEQLSPLAAQLKIGDYELKQFVQIVRGSNVVSLVSRESQTRSTYVKPEDAVAARFHFGLEEVPSTATLLNSIGKDFDADESAVAQAFEVLGKRAAVKQGRQLIKGKPTPGMGGTKYGKGFQITYPLYCNDPTAVAIVRRYMASKNIEATPAGIPGNYRNVTQALEARGVLCDPSLLSVLIKRSGQTPRLDELKRPYLDDGGIDAVVRQAQSLPPLTDKFMTFEDLVVICKQAGLRDITTEDIHNLYRADILGLQPLRREGRMEVLRFVNDASGTITLGVYFKRFFAGEVVERLQLMQRTMRLSNLRRWRHSR